MSGGTDDVKADPRNAAPSSVPPSSVPSAATRWEFMHMRGAPEWSPDLPEEFHGWHVPKRRRAFCERIEWMRVHPPLAAVRVTSHTCNCSVPVYELCALGGAYSIRRTLHERGKHEIHESPHMIASQAGELWTWLLHGTAR